MHVLLVEEDNELATRIGRGLSQAGFVVSRAINCDQAATLGLQQKAGAIVLDLDLRGSAGRDVVLGCLVDERLERRRTRGGDAAARTFGRAPGSRGTAGGGGSGG